jgi:phosphoglycerol geranylgeranyltransferase
MILGNLISQKGYKKSCVWLIDPDKCSGRDFNKKLNRANDANIDLIFVGGSLIHNHVDYVIDNIKALTEIPVVLFPGSPLQLCFQSDALLLLSLISGRNADYLIGNHVVAAPFIRESGIEIIPTGYILIDGGRQTSVSYMSNTQPIPYDKPDIALATAMAGEMLGLKVIYLDAGSGAIQPVSATIIKAVAEGISLPLLVGGGLRTEVQVEQAFLAGADVVVIGSVAEEDDRILSKLTKVRDMFNS